MNEKFSDIPLYAFGLAVRRRRLAASKTAALPVLAVVELECLWSSLKRVPAPGYMAPRGILLSIPAGQIPPLLTRVSSTSETTLIIGWGCSSRIFIPSECKCLSTEHRSAFAKSNQGREGV